MKKKKKMDMSKEPGPKYLEPTFFLDADHADVRAYAKANTREGQSDIEKAVSLYYAIRDGFRYNPYQLKYEPENFKASSLLKRSGFEGGHCIDKANLLASCARALGIPARLGFANVKNHIGTERLEEILGTDLLVFHGYAELWLEDKWVIATPAFNKELCEHLGVLPLEFDGKTDSMFQEYDREGGKFMLYIHSYGQFDDIPYNLMIGEWVKFYPEFIERQFGIKVS